MPAQAQRKLRAALRLTSGKQGDEDDEVEDKDEEYKRQDEEEADELKRLKTNRGRGRGRARGKGRGGKGQGRGRKTQEGNQDGGGSNEVGAPSSSTGKLAPTAAPAPNSAPTPPAAPAPPAAKEDQKDKLENMAKEAEAKVHQDMQDTALERHQGGGEEGQPQTPRKLRGTRKASAKATPKRKANRATPKKRVRRAHPKTPKKAKGDDEGNDGEDEEKPGDTLTPRTKKRKVSQD